MFVKYWSIICKKAAECVILLHLVAALPIVINPPSQFFEEILRIPKGQFFFVLSFLLYVTLDGEPLCKLYNMG